MFKIGSTVQALDEECGIWRTGNVKEVGDGKNLIQWTGYGNASWIEDAVARAPIRKRTISSAHLSLRAFQRGDDFRKTIPGGGLSPMLAVETNDPFKCEIKTVGIVVKSEHIAEESSTSENNQEADQRRHKRKRVSIEKPAKLLDRTEGVMSENVRGVWGDFEDGIDTELVAMSEDYEDVGETDKCNCTALTERVRILEEKNTNLTTQLTSQQTTLDRQASDMLSLHQRLIALELPRTTPQRQLHRPSTSTIITTSALRPTMIHLPQPHSSTTPVTVAPHQPQPPTSTPVVPRPAMNSPFNTPPARSVAPPRPRDELPTAIKIQLK